VRPYGQVLIMHRDLVSSRNKKDPNSGSARPGSCSPPRAVPRTAKALEIQAISTVIAHVVPRPSDHTAPAQTISTSDNVTIRRTRLLGGLINEYHNAA
jgi:hypothetical protein